MSAQGDPRVIKPGGFVGVNEFIKSVKKKPEEDYRKDNDPNFGTGENGKPLIFEASSRPYALTEMITDILFVVNSRLKVVVTERKYKVFSENIKVFFKGEERILRGEIDDLGLDIETGNYVVLDIKTTRYPDEKKFKEAITKRKTILQLRCYSALLKEQKNLRYFPKCYIVACTIDGHPHSNISQKTTIGCWEVPTGDLISRAPISSVFNMYPDHYGYNPSIERSETTKRRTRPTLPLPSPISSNVEEFYFDQIRFEQVSDDDIYDVYE